MISSANQNFCYVDSDNVHLVKGDPMPIGAMYNQDYEKKYTTHNYSMEQVKSLYLFSDGYKDQFGGSPERKFMTTGLKELLYSVHHLPAKKQKELIEKEFVDWKGNLDQLDDVLLMGFNFEA